MAQSASDSLTSPPMDAERVYCSSAVIKRVGRAVAVSLEDATLPGNAKNKHMTILYRGGKKWSNEEIESIRSASTKWMVDNLGSEQAPVTFTIHAFGRKSMAIKGDLEEMCLFLRERFGAMTDDDQRIAHVELFVGKQARQRMGGGDKGTKMCHICGGTGHFKKRCPMKDTKRKRHGLRARNMKRPKTVKSPKANNPERVRAKLCKIMARIQRQKELKQSEIALLESQQNELAILLSNVEAMDGQTVNESLKNIAKSFKRNRKSLMESRRHLKKGRSSRSKAERKRMKGIRKKEKMAKKEERKRAKLEMKEKLAAARCSTLPPPMGDGSALMVHVDGYNLTGCDAECRKAMRGRRGGMKRSRQRIARLLKERFMERADAPNVRVTLWFDGKGRNEKYGDIEIAFSSKEQIVDDKLVEMLCGTKANVLVVTSDKKLTVRLHDIGVRAMKSGVFYKRYLRVNAAEKMEVDGNEEEPGVLDEKEQNEVSMEEVVITDDFDQVIAGKVECGQNDEEEYALEGDSGDNDDDDTDGAPDEMEGDVHRYGTPVADEGEDSDFMEIFGDEEDMEMME